MKKRQVAMWGGLAGFISEKHLADSLNKFDLRFDKNGFKEQINSLRDSAKSGSCKISLATGTVVRMLRLQAHCGKSPGPDQICGKVLKICAEQLGGICHYIFLVHMEQQMTSDIWNHSIYYPCCYVFKPQGLLLNEFTPVTLTPLVRKTFGKVINQVVQAQVQGFLDPLQFAYRVGWGVHPEATEQSLSPSGERHVPSHTSFYWLFLSI